MFLEHRLFMFMKEIETNRLIFRNYKNDEIEKIAGLVTNERVMKYVGRGILSEE